MGVTNVGTIHYIYSRGVDNFFEAGGYSFRGVLHY